MVQNEIIAINRETQTRFGLEPYNIEAVSAKDAFASGEFSDTATTVAAGRGLAQPKKEGAARTKWVQE